MKELFFIACLVSSTILTSDGISPSPLPINNKYKECQSNGGVEITVITPSPNQWFCYQQTNYVINTTIVSGRPTLFISYFQSPQDYKTVTFTGTNTSIGGYNVWNYTYGSVFCLCGTHQQQLIIYDEVTYDVAGCMILSFNIPCPSANVGSYYYGYNGYNIYTINITPYPPLCREQTIEVSGFLTGLRYNESMQWVQVEQVLKNANYAYFYYYNPFTFDFTPMNLNNLTVKVPPPDSCTHNTEYQVYIYIYGKVCHAAWTYEVKATQTAKSSLIYLCSLTCLTLMLLI